MCQSCGNEEIGTDLACVHCGMTFCIQPARSKIKSATEKIADDVMAANEAHKIENEILKGANKEAKQKNSEL